MRRFNSAPFVHCGFIPILNKVMKVNCKYPCLDQVAELIAFQGGQSKFCGGLRPGQACAKKVGSGLPHDSDFGKASAKQEFIVNACLFFRRAELRRFTSFTRILYCTRFISRHGSFTSTYQPTCLTLVMMMPVVVGMLRLFQIPN